MSNIEDNDNDENVRLIGKTLRDVDDNSIALIIPKVFARKLQIENSKVSMSLFDDFSGNKHLVVSKHYHEIVID